LGFEVKLLTIRKVVFTTVFVVFIFVVVAWEKVAIECTVEGTIREIYVETLLTLLFWENRLVFVFSNASVVSWFFVFWDWGCVDATDEGKTRM